MSLDPISKELVEQAFDWHINTSTPFSQNIFRYGTPSWGALLRLAREQYQLGRITELDEDDFYLLESDAGELAMLDGSEVMLDTPQPIHASKNLLVVYVRAGLEVKRLVVEAEIPDFGREE
jgi:hypothetical protein